MEKRNLEIFKFESKFYLCTDALKQESQERYDTQELIFHSQHPKFIATVEEIIEAEPKSFEGFSSLVATYVNLEGMLELYKISIVQILDNTDTLPRLKELLEKAAYWYVGYVAAADKKFGKPMLKYYNEHLKDLRVVCNKETGEWICIYLGEIKKFSNEAEMDNFLMAEYLIKEEHLKNGYINDIELAQ